MAHFDAIPQKSKFQLNEEGFVNLLTEELHSAVENRLTTLYTHQIQAVLTTKAWFEKRDWHGKPPKPALIVAPTGSGKTGIVTLLPYILRCPKVIILSPSPVISGQLAKAFGKYNAEDTFYAKTNVIPAADLERYIENVTIIHTTDEIRGMRLANLVIVNAQKFSGNSKMSLTNGEEVDNVREKFGSFTTIIVDEAHHYPADTWTKIVENFNEIGKQIIFLTATPYRKQKPMLGPHQEITFEIERQRLIGSAIRDIKFEEIMEIQKGHVRDFDADDIITLRQYILKYLEAHDRDVPEVIHKAMILVGQDKQLTEDLANKLGEIATFHTSDTCTDRNLEKFEKNDKCKILVVCGKLIEGYDKHFVSVCVILRKVRARVTFTQFIGRCQRLSKRNPEYPQDPVQAIVLSAPKFQQRKMFETFDALIEEGEVVNED